MLHIIKSLIIPFGILGLGFYLYPVAGQLPASQLAVLKWIPVCIATITLGLSMRFNRSRMFFSALSITLAYIVLQWYLPMADAVEADIVWAAMCALLPLNLAVLSLLRERGMFTWWGGTRFVLILLPMLLLYGIAQIYPDALQKFMATNLYEPNFMSGVNIYQGPMIVAFVVVLLLNGMVFAQTTPQNSSLFVAMLACVVMLHYWDEAAAKALFASAMLLMLTVAVVQESWSMAYIDQLTNLPGRRALEEEMLKLGGNYSIAMLDIDHFKTFNDQYGHDAGDQVLSMVASHIRQTGAGGKAFRYGGEEFTIVFPGKKDKDTMAALDELRSGIAETRFQLRSKDRRDPARKRKQGGKKVSLTISIGVANRNNRMVTPHKVIKAADKALYRAKKQGRNRVCN